MAENISFKDLGLEVLVGTNKVDVNDSLCLEVKDYLSIADKTQLISFVVNGALDDTTGCFSPLRVEVYFSVAVCKWYAGIDFDFEDLTHIDEVYDALDTCGVISAVIDSIPDEEFQFLQDLVQDTIADIARYNSSAAGIIRMMTVDAGNLDSQLGEILSKVKDKEGLEILSIIKDAVGTD